jgi:hypothetical protein
VVKMDEYRIVYFSYKHLWELQERGDCCFWKWYPVRQWTDV